MPGLKQGRGQAATGESLQSILNPAQSVVVQTNCMPSVQSVFPGAFELDDFVFVHVR